MIIMTLKAAKGGFFDRKKVTDAVDKTTRRIFSKFGAFVRQRARSSIRKRKDIARPGQPPSSHAGLIRTFLFFAWDQGKKSVVIGPARINRPAVSGRYTVPELMEYGGQVPGNGKVIYITRKAGRDKAGRFVSKGKQRVVLDGMLRYKPHPFMRPAFDAELPGLPPMWRDSIR